MKAPFGVVVDEPDEMLSFTLDSILPLPLLISGCSLTKAIWAAAVRQGEIILLVDFLKLSVGKPAPPA